MSGSTPPRAPVPPAAQEIPSPIDFSDCAQARAWVEDTVARRPWRSSFFDAFSAALAAHFTGPISVAELGSGPGHLARAILRSESVRSYLALDFSPAMHRIAQDYLGNAARVSFVVADFRVPDWPSHIGAVDAFVTMQAAHEVRHKTRLPELLEQIRSTIRPGGLLLFCDHYAESGSGKNADLYVSRGDQKALLADAEFDPVKLIHDEGGMALYAATRPYL